MKQAAMTAILAAVLGGIVVRECFPRREQVIKPVPQIVTVHDTVKVPVQIKGPRVVTTDTVQLIIRETIHDTVQLNVNADSAQRPALWPVLNAQIGKSRGDTSQVITFSLRSGQTAVSKLWTPAPLRGIYADTTPTPRLDFFEPLQPRAVSLLTKIKWSSVGYAACRLREELR